MINGAFCAPFFLFHTPKMIQKKLCNFGIKLRDCIKKFYKRLHISEKSCTFAANFRLKYYG